MFFGNIPCSSSLSIDKSVAQAAKEDALDGRKADLIYDILALDNESVTLARAEKIMKQVKRKIEERATLSKP